MKTRREVIRLCLALFAGTSALWGRIGSGVRSAIAETSRRLLKKGTALESLIGQDPADLDASELEITPLESFGTMGQTNYSISAGNWRLKIGGKVDRPMTLTYDEMVNAPFVERDVLLICPGFFAHHGRWKGASGEWLLKKIGATAEATEIEFSGPGGAGGRSERFPLDEVLSNKIFLAYRVNGRPLPKQHGFPLRLVAEDHYGSRWVKYVDKITVG